MCVWITWFSSVQSLSRVWLFAVPWTAAHQASLSITNSRSLSKFMSTDSVMPSNHLILCLILYLLLLPSIFPSIRVFSNESALHIRWPKYWSFTFNISPSNEYSGLISFRIDSFDLCAVKGTLKSLFQHHTSKHQFNLLYGPTLTSVLTTGINIPFTIQTCIGKVMFLLFNMLSRFIITFLPRSKCLLISWLQSLFAVFGAQENNVCHCFHCFPIYLPSSDGTRCHDLHFLSVKFYASFFTLLFHFHQETF